MSHARRCRYCRRELADGTPTFDHVIPKWALKLLPFKNHRARVKCYEANRVTACRPCNRRKGSMPVAIFLTIHLEPAHVIKAERSRWDKIAAGFSVLSGSAHLDPLFDMVVAEFLKPIPAHFPTREVKLEPSASAQAVDWVRG